MNTAYFRRPGGAPRRPFITHIRRANTDGWFVEVTHPRDRRLKWRELVRYGYEYWNTHDLFKYALPRAQERAIRGLERTTHP